MHLIFVTLALLLPPCATEGANNCHWDASTQGNGQGTNFVALNTHVIKY